MTVNDLKENGLILFEAISGSRSFGLETESSDTDIKGVFYLPKDKFFGLEYIPQVNNETNDIVYYELGRFIELLLKNNPNILELLASPKDCILYKHPAMDAIHVGDFLSLLCKDTFAGYAAGQIRKATGLNKKIVNPVASEKKDLLNFCYVVNRARSLPLNDWLRLENKVQEKCGLVKIAHAKDLYALFYDTDDRLGLKGVIKSTLSNQVQLSAVPANEKPIAYLHCNHDAYSTYSKDYTQYWEWIEKRNEDRYNTNREHGKNYDSKNMMHTIRLLQSGYNILSTGQLNVKVANRQELLNIKAGKMNYDDIIEYSEKLVDDIRKAADTCMLPERPDYAKAEKMLINIRKSLYQ